MCPVIHPSGACVIVKPTIKAIAQFSDSVRPQGLVNYSLFKIEQGQDDGGSDLVNTNLIKTAYDATESKLPQVDEVRNQSSACVNTSPGDVARGNRRDAAIRWQVTHRVGPMEMAQLGRSKTRMMHG